MKELSQSDIYSLLSTAIRQGRSASSIDSPWVRDVYDTYLVYSDTDGKLYQRSYEIDAVTEDVTLGDPVEVVQVTSYAPVARTSSFSLPSPPHSRTRTQSPAAVPSSRRAPTTLPAGPIR
jgi:hypothetical protein